jgi:L-ribulokinase
MAEQFAIGVDYGTNSVRALVVNIATGAEVASHVYDYPSGDAGILVDPRDPNLARQNPADYIQGFMVSVREAVAAAAKTPGFAADRVVGIGVDTTGSTPIPVNAAGQALATLPEFKNNLAAYAWLWKDHTSHAEAMEITTLAKERNEPYLAKCGGTYSSEWYWSKMLHCARTAPDVAEATYGWVECADFIPAYITGNTNPDTLARSICAAGHKAMYNEQWGGLPSEEFLAALHPKLASWRYTTKAVASDKKAGELISAVADEVGLPAGIPVAVGAFDAHMGAVGAGATAGVLVKIMGTSTCDCLPSPLEHELPDVPGVCGIVPESIVPGMYGIEAGQSAVGDIFNWFVKHLSPASYGNDAEAHRKLTAAAAKLKPGESGLVALDWNNGNRTILVDPLLTGLLVGQTLHTTAPEVYRALVEATAFGALTIIRRVEEYGVKVDQVVNCGGIAEKNAMVMQIYADVCNRPMKISRSGQTCALGAAVFGAVVAGAHPNVQAAQTAMTGVKETVYTPIPENVAVYEKLYDIYRLLHDAFGTADFHGSLHHVMKDLIQIRSRARRGE